MIVKRRTSFLKTNQDRSLQLVKEGKSKKDRLEGHLVQTKTFGSLNPERIPIEVTVLMLARNYLKSERLLVKVTMILQGHLSFKSTSSGQPYTSNVSLTSDALEC